MELIKQTNKGEIRIFKHKDINYCIAKGIIGFELAQKYASKYNAVIPNISELMSYPLNKLVNN